MEHKKDKNVFLRLAFVLFFLTLISVWMTSGIYAKYCKIGSANDNAGVASFSVTAEGETKSLKGLTADYKITLENKSETAVKYDIVVTVSNDFSGDVDISLGETSPTVSGKVYTFTNAGNLDVNSKAEKNLIFSVEKYVSADNSNYRAECPFDVEVKFTQID